MGKFERIEVGRRIVDIFLPDDRAKGPRPLLLMHDGHNAFFPEHSSFGGVWRADEAVESLRIRGPKPVVAAVWHLPGKRETEYVPQDVVQRNPGIKAKPLPGVDLAQLRGNAYVRTLADKVIPAVSELADIRTDPAGVGLVGASAGAWISLYAMAKRPDAFGTAMCLSMPWFWATNGFIEGFVDLLPGPSRGNRIWHDHGTADYDRGYGPAHVRADARLQRAGWAWPQAVSNTYIGHGHNEGAWAARLPEVLQWWLNG